MLTFILLLLAAICLGGLTVYLLVTAARGFMWLLPLGLLLWELTALIGTPLPA
jgi:hypothetical protein